MSLIYCHLNFHANLLRPWRFPLRWVYTPGATVMQRICDVAFNIAIPSQRQRMSSLTIASENFRRKDDRKLSQQS